MNESSRSAECLAIVQRLKNRRIEQLRSGRTARLAHDLRRIAAIFNAPHGGARAALGLVASVLLRRLTRILRAAARLPSRRPSPTRTTQDQPRVAIRITGGLGDAIVITRWIRQFVAFAATDKGVAVDVFFAFPDNLHFLTEAGRIDRIIPVELFEDLAGNYDLVMTVSQFVTVHRRLFDSVALSAMTPKLAALVDHIEHRQQPFAAYFESHPQFDGAFADEAIRCGASRRTFLSRMAGFPEPSDRLGITQSDLASLPVELPARFITIHDGWDTSFRIASRRPTKAYNIDQFAQVVALLKKRFPGYPIIQVGTTLGEHIPGVALDLRGKTSLADVAAIIGRAAAHIDIEGGLVHLAAALGARSVVMFGPTSVDYYAYPQNINLAPALCGNCMWTVSQWMDFCPAGYEEAVCMRSIEPARVVEGAARILAVATDNEQKMLSAKAKRVG